MVRGLEQIGTLGLMAGGAHLNLGRRALHRILARVQGMAAGAGNVGSGMRAGRPVVGRVGLMTTQADGILFWCRRNCLGTEINHARQGAATGLHVRTPGTVTGLALQAARTEGTLTVPGARVLGMKQARDARIAVTSQTGVSTLRAITGVGRARRSNRSGRRSNLECAQRYGRAQQQGERGQRSGTRRASHSIHRGRDVVHDLHVGDATWTVAESTGLNQRRIAAENRPSFGIL